MGYNKNVIDIIRESNFRTFWNCFEYLIHAGYNCVQAFDITLKEFGESRIFREVAFIRKPISNIYLEFISTTDSGPKVSLIVGLVNDDNIHLSGLYDCYRKTLYQKRGIVPQIEQTCELIEFYEINHVIIEYLLNVSKMHFGYEFDDISDKKYKSSVSASAVSASALEKIDFSDDYARIKDLLISSVGIPNKYFEDKPTGIDMAEDVEINKDNE